MSTKMKSMLLLLLAAAVVFGACSRKTETVAEKNPQAQEQLVLAEKYLNEKKYDEAIAALKESIELDPGSSDAYIMLSEIYADQEMMEEAAEVLKQGVETVGDEAIKAAYVQFCLDRADDYYDDEDFDLAIEAYEEAISTDDSTVDAYMGLHELYLVLEDYENADLALERGCEATDDETLKETRFASLFELSERFIAEENYEYAIPCLVKIVEAEKGDNNTLIALSTAYSAMEEYGKAIEILESFENQEDPEIKEVLGLEYAHYGEQLFNEGSSDEAVTYLNKAIELIPGQIDPYITLIAVYVDGQKMTEAGAAVDQSIARFMNAESAALERFDDLLYEISSYYAEKEDMAASLSFWEKAVALRPDDEGYKAELEGYRSSAADEAYMKAEELLEQGDAAGASSYYKRAFALSPSNFQAGLVSNSNGTYYINTDGTFKNGWHDSGDGDVYYFDPATGCSVMGWQTLDGSDYYFMDDGRMLTNEETPDGFYVGADGKKVDNGTVPAEPEDEETEEETEEQESTEAEEEEETETESSSQVSGDGKLRLNSDLLTQAKEKGGVYAVKKEELFTGAEGRELTLNDVYHCMEQYGMKVQWILEESTYELGMGDLVIWVFPGQSLAGDGVVVKDADQYRESLRAKTLPEGTTFAVQFDAKATGTNETVDLEMIESVNNK